MQVNKENNSQEHETQQEDAHDVLASDTSFFDKPKNVKIILNSFYATCLLLVILDFVIHRHIYLSFEKIPTFYAIYGFVACVLLVVLAKLMRLVLMRGEHYYDDRLDESPQPDKELSANLHNGPIAKTENYAEEMDNHNLTSQLSSGDKK